jgi:hypothetical protein
VSLQILHPPPYIIILDTILLHPMSTLNTQGALLARSSVIYFTKITVILQFKLMQLQQMVTRTLMLKLEIHRHENRNKM